MPAAKSHVRIHGRKAGQERESCMGRGSPPRAPRMRAAMESAFWKCILAASMSANDATRLESVCGAPILVVGAPRSGTTLVQRALLADPRCCGGQESHFFASFGPALRDFDRKRGMERPHGLACYWTRAQIVAQLRVLWMDAMGGVVRAATDAERLVEKTPDHALWLDVIAEVLPQARVVHVVRDSRAVCASLLAAGRTSWGSPWAPKSAASAARIWRAHVEAVARCRLPVHRLSFERLQGDPQPVLSALWEFVGLDADERTRSSFLDEARRGSTQFRGTGEIAESPPEPPAFMRGGAVDGWKRELGWLDRRRIWRETGGLMQSLGYREDGSVVVP